MINWNILPTTEDPVTGNQWVDLEFLRALRQDLDEVRSLQSQILVQLNNLPTDLPDRLPADLPNRLSNIEQMLHALLERPSGSETPPPGDGYDFAIEYDTRNYSEVEVIGLRHFDTGASYTVTGEFYFQIPGQGTFYLFPDGPYQNFPGVTPGVWTPFEWKWRANFYEYAIRFGARLDWIVPGPAVYLRNVEISGPEHDSNPDLPVDPGSDSDSDHGGDNNLGGVVGGVGSELEGGGRPDEPQDP